MRGLTWLRMASERSRDSFLANKRKMRGVAIPLTDSSLRLITACSEPPRIKKGISPWKKVNAFFSQGASSSAQISRFYAKIGPSEGRKAAQIMHECAFFLFPHFFFLNLKRVKTTISLLDCSFLFVKNSETFFFTICTNQNTSLWKCLRTLWVSITQIEPVLTAFSFSYLLASLISQRMYSSDTLSISSLS